MGNSGAIFPPTAWHSCAQSSECRGPRALNSGVNDRRWPSAEASEANTHSPRETIGACPSGRLRSVRPLSRCTGPPPASASGQSRRTMCDGYHLATPRRRSRIPCLGQFTKGGSKRRSRRFSVSFGKFFGKCNVSLDERSPSYNFVGRNGGTSLRFVGRNGGTSLRSPPRTRWRALSTVARAPSPRTLIVFRRWRHT